MLRKEKSLFWGAFNAGEGNVAKAQASAEKAGKNPQLWSDVANYLTDETRQYIPNILSYQNEFSLKSSANKNIKQKEPKKQYRCTEGHWVTIDDHPVFICD
jgi:membrane-bound lytic murein transglycosylase MltF